VISLCVGGELAISNLKSQIFNPQLFFKTLMSITQSFEYYRPETLLEAVRMLSENGETARVLAGGTDLIPWMTEELVAPRVLVDIKDIDQLGGIAREKDGLIIGALVTFSDLIDSAIVRESLPLLWEMSKTVASPGIRNRATLAGNICSAVPSCDGGPVLLVHKAQVRVMGFAGERTIAIADWFLGPEEIVTSLFLPLPGKGHGGCYLKLGRYHGEDLAQASAAVLDLPDENRRIAFGAVAPTPVRARRIEALIGGKELTGEDLSAARDLVDREISPITDLRATEGYRRHMIRVMLERGLRIARSRRLGQGPPYGTVSV
jgi:CO/xanthine dehydrogenase FAD-binding subunit